jgi:hypothetical protein
MTVWELINELKKYDPDLPVWQSGGGDPYCMGEIIDVKVVIPPQGMQLMGHTGTPDKWVELG